MLTPRCYDRPHNPTLLFLPLPRCDLISFARSVGLADMQGMLTWCATVSMLTQVPCLIASSKRGWVPGGMTWQGGPPSSCTGGTMGSWLPLATGTGSVVSTSGAWGDSSLGQLQRL